MQRRITENALNAKRISYLTFMQVIAVWSMVCLHTNGCFWNFSGTERYWITANIIESIFYFAVPVFFMISGATLLDYQERYSTRKYFEKRIVKTVIPYIVWSFIIIIYKLLTHAVSVSDVTIQYIVKGLLDGQTICGIYWFFPALFSLYFCLPLFASVKRSSRKEIFTYLLIAGFVINIVIPFIKTIMGLDFRYPYTVNVIQGSLIWPVSGYLLHHYTPKKQIRFVLYATAIAGLLMHILGTYYLSMEAGKIISTYKGYNNVPCVLWSIGVFVFLKQVGERIMRYSMVNRIFTTVSKYTFAVYLIHWMVMDSFVNIFNIDNRSIVYRLGAPFLIIGIVMGITWIIRKIPVLRKIVP